MLITPRILDSVDEWEQVKQQFSDGLNYIDLEGSFETHVNCEAEQVTERFNTLAVI